MLYELLFEYSKIITKTILHGKVILELWITPYTYFSKGKTKGLHLNFRKQS